MFVKRIVKCAKWLFIGGLALIKVKLMKVCVLRYDVCEAVRTKKW